MITYMNHSFTSITQFSSQLFRYMPETHRSKNSKVTHTWLRSRPSFMRCFSNYPLCWTPVQNVYCCRSCFSPKSLRHIFSFQHTSCHVQYTSIFPLSYAIVLRFIGRSNLMLYTFPNTKFGKFSRGVFTTTVGS